MLNRSRFILLIILFFQLVLGVLYAVRTPHWQAPDEPAHYNYVRILAETGAFPVLKLGDYNQAYLDQIKSEKFPPDLSVGSIQYESHQPPLYYALATPFYLVSQALNLDTVLVLRLVNVALALVLSLIAFRIFRYVFPASPLLRLVGVGIIATLPMHIAMSAAINNDTLAEVILAVILLLSVLRVHGKITTRRFWIIGGIAYALALLTKTTIYSCAVLLIAAEISFRQITLARRDSSARRWSTLIPHRNTLLRAASTLVPLFAIALLISLPWFTRNILTYGLTDPFGWARHDSIVTGQPTTVQYIAQFGLKNVVFDFFAISFKSFWAQFGWMGVLVSDRIYTIFFLLTAVAVLGAILWAIRLFRERANFLAETRWTWLILGLLAFVAVAALVYYNLKFVQPQGRYVFPGLIAFAAFSAAGLNELLNARYSRLVFAVLYVIMLALDYICLAWFIVPQLARS